MITVRAATATDIEAMFDIRAATHENAIPRERLATLGITPASLREALAGGVYRAWVVEEQDQLLAFCGADTASGEVAVLAVRAGHQGRGLGRALLSQAVTALQAAGCPQLWLMASPDPALRSHGFYRAQGWVASGRHDAAGDEELVRVQNTMPPATSMVVPVTQAASGETA